MSKSNPIIGKLLSSSRKQTVLKPTKGKDRRQKVIDISYQSYDNGSNNSYQQKTKKRK
jgi:hypothetical protein